MVLAALFLSVNFMRIYFHEPWQDELQAWHLARDSATLQQLIGSLRYEGHPLLWYLLLRLGDWLIPHPVLLKLIQALVVAGFTLLFLFLAPLRCGEKVLALLSFCLLDEYTVISRPYGLVVLLAFGFAALRCCRPGAVFTTWLVLGLLANLHVLAAVVAISFGLWMVAQERERWLTHVPGVLAFLLLLGFSLYVMLPTRELTAHFLTENFSAEHVDRGVVAYLGELGYRLLKILTLNTVNVFVPLSSQFPEGVRVGQFGPAWFRLALVPVVLLLVWQSLRRDLDLFTVVLLTISGSAVIAFLFFPGSGRHTGLVFVAWLVALWLTRNRGRKPGFAVWLLLAINAVGGISTAGVYAIRPFSAAGEAARWIEDHDLKNSFWIGTVDYWVSPVFSRLDRPIYQLECGCERNFVDRGAVPRLGFDRSKVVARVVEAMMRTGHATAYLLLSNDPPTYHGLTDGDIVRARELGIDMILLASFDDAVVRTETYKIYRVERHVE